MNAPLAGSAFTPLWVGLDHPEDIVWDAERELLYAGGESGEIYRGTLDGAWEQIAFCGEGAFVLGIALDARGDLYVCERGNSHLLRIDAETFEITELSRGTAERPMICPNYAAFDSSGTLYVSDSGTWGENEGVIFAVHPVSGTAIWASAPTDFTNGIALSPDEQHLYVVESKGSKVWRILILPDGSAGRAELVWHVSNTVPDGLAFDDRGDLYISCYRPDSIYVVRKETCAVEVFAHDWTGHHLSAPTNLAFIGPRLDRLATANLAGKHVSVADGLGIVGHPLPRPVVTGWA